MFNSIPHVVISSQLREDNVNPYIKYFVITLSYSHPITEEVETYLTEWLVSNNLSAMPGVGGVDEAPCIGLVFSRNYSSQAVELEESLKTYLESLGLTAERWS
jgi:hypothetical protein